MSLNIKNIDGSSGMDAFLLEAHLPTSAHLAHAGKQTSSVGLS